MSGSDDDEAWYAVSFTSYTNPDKQAGFLQFASAITHPSGHLFLARPHWGKHTPSPITFQDLCSNHDRFMKIRDRIDPSNAFLPAWMALD